MLYCVYERCTSQRFDVTLTARSSYSNTDTDIFFINNVFACCASKFSFDTASLWNIHNVIEKLAHFGFLPGFSDMFDLQLSIFSFILTLNVSRLEIS